MNYEISIYIENYRYKLCDFDIYRKNSDNFLYISKNVDNIGDFRERK